jgi:hypothetical protein
MNSWVVAAIALALSLTAFHFAGKLITRVTGRSRGGVANLRSATAFFALLVVGVVLVSAVIPSSTPLRYVAYGIVGGIASLVSQLLFGQPADSAPEISRGLGGNPPA